MLRGSLEAVDADGGRLEVRVGEHDRALDFVPDGELAAALDAAASGLTLSGERTQVERGGVWALALAFRVGEDRERQGSICLARREREFQADEVGLLAELVQRAEKAAEDIVSHQQIRHQALTDPLTELANRRKLHTDLEERFAQPEGHAPSLLVVFDLDGFKPYNDTFGHQAGDALLARLGGKLAAAAAGAGGQAYRLGGDEFCGLMDVDP